MTKKLVDKSNNLKITQLFKATLRTWKADFNNFSKVILVIALPAAIVNILQNQGLIGEYGLILSLAWSFVIIAVLLMGLNKRQLKDIRLSTVFTASSARLLQYLGVSLVLIIFALPAIVGLLGLFLALPVFGISPWLFVPLGSAGLILGAYLLCRYAITQTIAVSTPSSIISSFKQSAKLTKGNRLRILIGYLVLFTVMLIVLVAVQFLLGLNQSINENAFIGGAIYAIEAVVLVPIFFVFQVKIYEFLNEKA